MARSRFTDPSSGPADERMAAYLEGVHHPQHALAPRVAYVAIAGADVVGYIAGHLTRRYECQGEVQYLFVAPTYRRLGVARALVQRLAVWFLEQHAARICVNVDSDSAGARPFYVSLGANELRPHWMVWADIKTVLAGS